MLIFFLKKAKIFGLHFDFIVMQRCFKWNLQLFCVWLNTKFCKDHLKGQSTHHRIWILPGMIKLSPFFSVYTALAMVMGRGRCNLPVKFHHDNWFFPFIFIHLLDGLNVLRFIQSFNLWVIVVQQLETRRTATLARVSNKMMKKVE